MKSRGAYETPGGTLLVKAHQELERLTIDRETAHFQQALSLRYAELVYYGLWFAPLREALDGFFNIAQQRVTGAVGLKLWKGTLNVTSAFRPSLFIARTSPVSPWALQPQGCEGFINLFALPVTVRPKQRPKVAKSNSSKNRPMTERKDDRLWGGRFEREPNAQFRRVPALVCV